MQVLLIQHITTEFGGIIFAKRIPIDEFCAILIPEAKPRYVLDNPMDFLNISEAFLAPIYEELKEEAGWAAFRCKLIPNKKSLASSKGTIVKRNTQLAVRNFKLFHPPRSRIA